jgi:hypothetical protein
VTIRRLLIVLLACVARLGEGQSANAAIAGTVYDSIAGRPLRGALIQLVLADRPSDIVSTAISDSAGKFVLLNVPKGRYAIGFIHKTLDSLGLDIPLAQILVNDKKNVEANLAIALPHSAAGVAQLSGTVVAGATNRPVSGAIVTIANRIEARTNERGEWTIGDAPTGTHALVVRAIGYYPAELNVDVGHGKPVRVELRTLGAVLDSIRIVAKGSKGPDGGGFLWRKKTGMGRFITADDMQRFPVTETSLVFRRIHGVQLEGTTIFMNGAFGKCTPAVLINGHRVGDGSAEDIDDRVFPHEVAGIEVYSETTVPPEFQKARGGCGSIVIWTK